MAKYNQLQAPVTNPAANKRLQDTQALRARAAVGQAPANTPIAQAAQQTGAALTQQAGQQALQQQQQQAGIAKGQAGVQMAKQQQDRQQQLFGQEQGLQKSAMKLDQQLFNINQDAAKEQEQLRLNFNDRVAQQGYLQELDLANWVVANAQNEDQFQDRIQEMEQAHAKKSMMVNHAYKLIMQQMEQEAKKASGERKQQLEKQLVMMKRQAEEEMQRQKNKAANRRSMFSAVGTVVGAGLGAAASLIPGAQPLAPVLIAGGAQAGGSLGQMAAGT